MTAARGPSRTDLLPFFRGRTRDAGFAVTARCASVVRTERVPASSIPPLFPRGDQEIGWGAVQRIRGRDCERVVGLEVTLPKLRAVKIGGNGKEYQAASAPAGAPHIPRSFFFFSRSLDKTAARERYDALVEFLARGVRRVIRHDS